MVPKKTAHIVKHLFYPFMEEPDLYRVVINVLCVSLTLWKSNRTLMLQLELLTLIS